MTSSSWQRQVHRLHAQVGDLLSQDLGIGVEGFIRPAACVRSRLLTLAQRDIFVTELLADVITPDGQRLAEFIGMKPVRSSGHGSTICKALLLPPALRVTTRTGRQLLTYYERKYEEFKELLDLGQAGR